MSTAPVGSGTSNWASKFSKRASASSDDRGEFRGESGGVERFCGFCGECVDVDDSDDCEDSLGELKS